MQGIYCVERERVREVEREKERCVRVLVLLNLSNNSAASLLLYPAINMCVYI